MNPTFFVSKSRNLISAYHKMCEAVLEEFDLQQVSFDILMFLANNPEYTTAQEISEIRSIKKNLVSVHVEKLVQMGYLSRSSVEGDRRKIHLSCTEKAKPIVDAGRDAQEKFYQCLMAGVTAEQWKVYEEIHAIIDGNVQEILRKGAMIND